MRVLGVIPARLGSIRLPHKPLQLLAGEPLITRVVQRVLDFGVTDQLVVATDAMTVAAAIEPTGVPAVLTDPEHANGTSRVSEVAARPEFAGFDLILNVQGDEPFLRRDAVEGALAQVAGGADVGTAAAPLDPEFADDPSRVKVVTDVHGRALWFSRAPIPFRRDPVPAAPDLYWQHLGVYAYRRSALMKWVTLPATEAEQAERLEQLRALQHGITIGVARLDEPVEAGVDTPDDLRRAEARWLALNR
ncbi:MAG TPA: 3-deoxy-manno-octulosonate cytidylyltransferase [Gemmatimonadales bacterium]|nr:3-deoxy-manno-octulosonate cytidylyltransferase [Gemmatimonadales bacterium]